MNPYDFAIQMSRDGEKFFLTLAKQVKKPGLRKILTTLATDQADHRRSFEEMKKKSGVPLPDVRGLSEAVNPFARRLKRLDLGQKVEEDLPPEELYRRGQELDEECVRFYQERAARAKDPLLKQTLLEFAEQQRKHHVALEHLITFISEPQQQLEDAEWNVANPLE